MEFLWNKDVKMPEFPQLTGDAVTDVLIIGGGMAGVLCAKKLREAGVDCLLAEGGKIGQGITKGTTAVLSAQHDELYQDMIRKSGRAMAGQYLQANRAAVGEFGAISEKIDCDFEILPSVMYSIHDGPLMKREAHAVRSLGFPAEFSLHTAMPFAVAGAVIYPGMAQFHPLKFMAGAAQGLNIREHTFVEGLEGTTARTRTGKIRANRVIVTSHFPFINRYGLYFMKLYQMRSFVVAYENAPNLGCTLVDAQAGGLYLRNYKDLLIVGGGDRRTGRGCGGYDIVRDFAQ